MRNDTTTALALGGIGIFGLLMLGTGSKVSASSPRPAGKRSTRGRSSAKPAAPRGEIDVGPLEQVITNPDGTVTRKRIDGTTITTRTNKPGDRTDITKPKTDEVNAHIDRAQARFIAQRMADDPRTDIDDPSWNAADWALIEEELFKITDPSTPEMRSATSAALQAARIAARMRQESWDAEHLDEFNLPKALPVTKGPPPLPVVPPRASPTSSAPTSPPTPINLERARKTAPNVAAHIRTKKQKYDRRIVEQFQADAGLVPDGLYGPVTADALRHFGVKNSPPAVFKGGAIKKYIPPNKR